MSWLQCKINEHMEHGLMLKFKGSLLEDICLIAYNDHQLLDYNGIKIFLDAYIVYHYNIIIVLKSQLVDVIPNPCKGNQFLNNQQNNNVTIRNLT